MDYTQNSKIEQVKESTLIIGIDVGSGILVTGTLNEAKCYSKDTAVGVKQMS